MTRKPYSKRNCPQKDLLMLKNHEGGRKKNENSLSRKKWEKKVLILLGLPSWGWYKNNHHH
jgi:hypothetical protein